MNHVQDILSQYPPSNVNNSREIIRAAIKRYQENPNDRNAKILENYGLSVDHDDYFEHYDETESHNQTNNHEK